jgi:hypothetical protein
MMTWMPSRRAAAMSPQNGIRNVAQQHIGAAIDPIDDRRIEKQRRKG